MDDVRHLGFDLHDGVCQELVGINILIESVRHQMSAGSGPIAVAKVQRYLTHVGEHLHRMARDLRPLQLHDLGLADSLRALAAGMSNTAVAVRVTCPTDIPRLGEETEVAVYRVAQEALTNVLHHATARTIAVGTPQTAA